MVSKRGNEIKLIDFALQNIKQKDKINAFASPEIVHEGIHNKKSDMWPIGVVLYTLISGGTLPF